MVVRLANTVARATLSLVREQHRDRGFIQRNAGKMSPQKKLQKKAGIVATADFVGFTRKMSSYILLCILLALFLVQIQRKYSFFIPVFYI